MRFEETEAPIGQKFSSGSFEFHARPSFHCSRLPSSAISRHTIMEPEFSSPLSWTTVSTCVTHHRYNFSKARKRNSLQSFEIRIENNLTKLGERNVPLCSLETRFRSNFGPIKGKADARKAEAGNPRIGGFPRSWVAPFNIALPLSLSRWIFAEARRLYRAGKGTVEEALIMFR